jgi:F0F1-type ATP synthase epsilon subunit
MDSKFNLIIRSREGVVFQGAVDSVTSFNEEGIFDILALHANFISLIQKKLIIRPEGDEKEIMIDFDTALLRVRENSAEVYLGFGGVKSSQLKENPEIMSESQNIPA